MTKDKTIKKGDTVYRHWRESPDGDRYGGGLHTVTKIGDDLSSIEYDMFDANTIIMVQSMKGEIIQSSCSELSLI